MKKPRLLALSLCLPLLIGGCAGTGAQPGNKQKEADAMRVVQFTDNGKVLHNPQMGWEAGASAEELLVYGIPAGYDVIQFRESWDVLEPEEGKYNWDKLDKAIALCKAKGVSVELGMYLQGSDVFGFTGIPDWIWTKYKIPYQIVDTSDFTVLPGRDDYVATKHPLYYNKLYQEKVSNFLKAVAEHYPDGTVDIVYVRPYGLYGEWDAGWNQFDWKGDRELKRKTLRELVQIYADAFQSYKETRLFIDVPAQDGGVDKYRDYKEEAAYDLAMEHGFGIRFCGLGPGNFYGIVGYMIDEHFPRSPVTSETWFGWEPQTYDVDETLESFYRFRCNVITFGMPVTGTQDIIRDENREMFDTALKTIGYRLLPTTIEYPSSIRAGSETQIYSCWSNLGVGVCWKQYPIRYSLHDAQGKAVWSYTDKAFDQTAWVKGNDYEFTSKVTIPQDIAPGDYTLRIALVDKDGKARIALPIEKVPDVREYAIGSVHIYA